jgi:hypothetical protein
MDVNIYEGVLPAQVRHLIALALPAVAGWLAGKVSGTDAAGWTTVITYVLSGAYFIYDTFIVKRKIAVALNTPSPNQGVTK